ncbi:MAG TPA: sigma-70 family RNA polymerase sigma factor [Terriglobales bacterium]|nr:sigma-70 family RNA polymerase sigma factor [Terriglobales bacterium]
MEPAELRIQLEALHAESFGWALACSDPWLAESVLQRSYLKVLEGRARYDARSSFKTWFFGVVRNTAREERRRALWRKLRLLPPEAAEAIARPGSAEVDLVEAEQREAFRRLLARLPRRQCEALHLVFYQELTLEEAAQAMGIGLGSARTHYERGKKRLREMLEQEQVEYDARRARA